MRTPIITLTTDFGISDPYVAEMKGVIVTVNPSVRIVDVTHEIAAQQVRQAALCVLAMYRYFPAGTIHVVVVDPGVGSGRRLLCVAMHGQIFLGPDNGVLSWSGRGATSIQRTELTESRFWRDEQSATFHGRDILAPVAAHLSLGIAPDQLGRPVGDWVELTWPRLRRSDACVAGEVLAIDRFGNLISSVSTSDVPVDLLEKCRVQCGDCDIGRIARTYSDVQEGELVALFGSGNLLEIAVRNGNAAKHLKAIVGATVSVRFRADPGEPQSVSSRMLR